MSIGQILLLPKPLLEKRVLSDERIEVYECGRDDIRSGQIDRRVLATLAYLAESGLRPTVTSLKCGHGFYTSSGNVSEHSSGNAVDIAMINGIPILGHQEPGRHHRAGRPAPHAAPGHDGAAPDHLPASRSAARRSRWATTPTTSTWASSRCSAPTRSSASRRSRCSSPASGPTCISRLREIENPVVPTKPSKYSLPAKQEARQQRPRGRVDELEGPFGFVQLEFGFLLGPARRPLPGAAVRRRAGRERARAEDARRAGAAAARAATSRARSRTGRAGAGAHHRGPRSCAGPPFPSGDEAASWLAGLRGTATRSRPRSMPPSRVLNRALHAHRVAAADPYVTRGVSPSALWWCGSATAAARRWPTGGSRRRRAAALRAAPAAALDGGARGALRRAAGRARGGAAGARSWCCGRGRT